MKSRRFRYFLLATAIMVVTLASVTAHYFRIPSREMTRQQFGQLLQEKLIHDGKVKPTPYAGIYRIDGRWKSASELQPFSITTRLDEEQVKNLLAQPDVTIEVPGMGLQAELMNFVTPVVLVALIGGVLLYQMNIGRGKHGRVRQRPTVRFNDVAGVDEAKAEVREVVDFLKDPKKYRRLGGQMPRGILLVGPPGTGKTMLAKAIAGEAEAHFFSAHGSDFNEVFVGVGAKRVRHIFREAARHKPAIIFIDEIDCLGKNRKFDSNGEYQQTNNALLAAMDGFEEQR